MNECPGIFETSQFVAIKAFDKHGGTSEAVLLRSLKYVEDNSIRLVVLPFNSSSRLSDLKREIKRLSLRGVIFVCSVGNQKIKGRVMEWPATSRWVITVGSLTHRGNRVADFSIIGPMAIKRDQSAEDVRLTKPDFVIEGSGLVGQRLESSCRKNSGTSFSAVLLASVIKRITDRHSIDFDLASLLRVIQSIASKLTDDSIFQQGHGHISYTKLCSLLCNDFKLSEQVPWLILSSLDLSPVSGSYFHPFSSITLYQGRRPVCFILPVYARGYYSLSFRTRELNTDLISVTSSVIYETRGDLFSLSEVKLCVSVGNDQTVQSARDVLSTLKMDLVDRETRRVEFRVISLRVRVSQVPPPDRVILFDNFHRLGRGMEHMSVT